MKVILETDSKYGYIHLCPTCKTFLCSHESNCPKCNEYIEWEEWEDILLRIKESGRYIEYK